MAKPKNKYVVFKDWSIGRVYHVAVAEIEKETEKQVILKQNFDFYSSRARVSKEDVLLITSNRIKAAEMRDLFKESSRRYRAYIDRIQIDLIDEYECILKHYRT